jgi:hypothetical protein
VSGQIVDDAGDPLTEAQVTLRSADGNEQSGISDAEGRYRFEDVPVGPAELTVAAPGFEQTTLPLKVGAQMPEPEPVAMVPRPPAGIVRGLTRSFDSEPLQARVRVLDRRGREVGSVQADAEGRFEISVPPGRYRVTIRAQGYRAQTRRVKIDDGSVTILNVDLRERR